MSLRPIADIERARRAMEHWRTVWRLTQSWHRVDITFTTLHGEPFSVDAARDRRLRLGIMRAVLDEEAALKAELAALGYDPDVFDAPKLAADPDTR